MAINRKGAVAKLQKRSWQQPFFVSLVDSFIFYFVFKKFKLTFLFN